MISGEAVKMKKNISKIKGIIPFPDKNRIDFKGPLPLYRQIKDLILEQVHSECWDFEEAMPSENELAAAFSVSVGTIKKAFAELVHEGVLVRRQGRGTFIARPSFNRSFIRFFRFAGGEVTENEIPASRVINMEITPPTEGVREVLRLEPGERVIYMKRLRLLRDIPLALEDLYLPEKRFAGFEKMDISHELLYPIYAKDFGVPILWADEYLEPRQANEEAAFHLSINVGDPIMRIERIAHTYRDEPVEYRIGLGRGDRFRYHLVLR